MRLACTFLLKRDINLSGDSFGFFSIDTPIYITPFLCIINLSLDIIDPTKQMSITHPDFELS